MSVHMGDGHSVAEPVSCANRAVVLQRNKMCHKFPVLGWGVRVSSMSIRQLRDSLSSLGEIVERDREILITRHGRVLAKLVPPGPPRSAPSHSDLRAGMPYLAVSSEELIRQERERG